MRTEKKVYVTPEVVVHGTFQELTQQIKTKTYGAGDDVMLISGPALSNFS